MCCRYPAESLHVSALRVSLNSSSSLLLSLWSYVTFPTRIEKGYKMGEAVRAGEISIEPPSNDDSRKRSRYKPHAWEGQGKTEKHSLADEAEIHGGASTDILLQSNFILDDIGPVCMVLSSEYLTWNGLEDQVDIGLMWCCGLLGGSERSNKLKITEIYSVETYETGNARQDGVHSASQYANLVHNQTNHLLIVHSYEKVHKQKATWVPRAYVFQHADISVCKRWASQIQALIDGDTNRPKQLLVVVNPHSGKKTAWKTWQEVSCLFSRAKINTMVLKTERVRHGFDVMNSFSDQDLAALDGVVVVGGDGLFNEILNGLLLRHHKARLPRKPEDLSKAFSSSDPQEVNLMENRRDDRILSTNTWEQSYNEDSAALPDSTDIHPFLESLATNKTGSRSFDRTSVRSLLSELQCHEDKPPDLAEMAFPSSSANDRDHNFHTAQFKDGGFVIQNFSDENVNPNGITGEIRGGSSADGMFVFPNQKFRLGIIPAGSTDSVAVSTTGSRNPATSALHIIFGEKTPLDIVRLVSWKNASTTLSQPPRIRYAASFAGYGFYGDVIKESEPSRWMGPLRYDYAGTKVFLQHKTYEAEVSYVELPETKSNVLSLPSRSFEESSRHRKMQKRELSRMVCGVNCDICLKGCDYSDIGEKPEPFVYPQKGPHWKHVKGSFISIGAAVISCRNDKAPNGIAASAHLADGLLHLILVKGCSHLSYLRHLIRLTREDADPLDFGFIEEYKTPCFNFVSKGEESIWNVDGELFLAQQLSAQVFRGLVNIFASGPDV